MLLRALLAALLTLGLTAAAQAGDRQKAAATVSKQDVVMYVLPDCGYCEKMRSHLRERGVSWKEKDIAASPQAKQEFDARGGQGTPLTLVGDAVIAGYQPAAVDAALTLGDDAPRKVN
ncbi:glutaredoxin family protein [Tahibacter amnicola]|uniref:Glutaredoxin domain-containing protein n=1 Tax=Tahibacter amnicola TaxID=2976241 RepID=A0ABY6BGC7_9GAMM|nr:glutaredoxin domain-containing protein [Tahibacter amnicola]UXI69068.1 hypothetical protein N4264_05295 [Tahibacter amnicola]